jgi:hypothetical protein
MKSYSQGGKEIKKVGLIVALGIPLIFSMVVGLNYPRVKGEVERFYPSIKQNLTLTEKAVKDRRYEEALQLTEQTVSLWDGFDLECGNFQIFLKKGREINGMYRESCQIKHTLTSLKNLEASLR